MRILVLAAALLLALAAPATAQSGDGSVTVVHGIPGVTVDVWVDGEPLLEGFEPGTITDPVSLPAGSHRVEVYAAGSDPDAEEALFGATIDLPAGANASAVAHLTEAGEPGLTAFVNDTSAIAAGEARLTVRHTAAAPPVDVRAGGEPVFPDLANAAEASADLPAGTVSADVVLAGGADPLLGPADLSLGAGTSTIVYAVGSAENGTLDLLIQTIGDLGSAPTAIEAGSGGLAADSTAMPVWAFAGLLLGAAAVAASPAASAPPCPQRTSASSPSCWSASCCWPPSPPSPSPSARVPCRWQLPSSPASGSTSPPWSCRPQAGDGAYMELWLLAEDLSGLVSLGPLRPGRPAPVPGGVDLAAHPVVDVSREPLDGDPGHSGDSVLRGRLPADAPAPR